MSSPRPDYPEQTPWGGHPETPPPAPPAWPAPPAPPAPEGYQPFQQYYQPAAPPSTARQRNGITGAIVTALLAAFSFFKYGGLFLLKFGAVKTILTLLISFGFYAWGLGWLAAGALVVMILLHEMGHVFEIRRQGMKATAPLFIPFFGAAIFQKQHATDALHQAQIGIAGPIAGTLASIAALVLYSATRWEGFLIAAFFGFGLNLFNMIPFGMLDGGWVLSAASKWFQVAGGALFLAVLLYTGWWANPVSWIIALIGVQSVYQRFKNDRQPYYQSVPLSGRLLMGFAWLGLVAVLIFGLEQTISIIRPLT
ncbi:MAG: site-2 protease family protein [Chloroflexota bacterium]